MRPGLVRSTCGAVHASVIAATVVVAGYPGRSHNQPLATIPGGGRLRLTPWGRAAPGPRRTLPPIARRFGVPSLRWQRRIPRITAHRSMPGAALPVGLSLPLILAEPVL